MTLTVDVISDAICPWCYIGKRRLEKAVAAFAGRNQVRVRWHPFQLNPHMPREGMERKDYRTAKFGSWERSLALDAQVAEAGRAGRASSTTRWTRRTAWWPASCSGSGSRSWPSASEGGTEPERG